MVVKRFAALKRTQVHFPASDGSFQSAITPVQKDTGLLSSVGRHICGVLIYTQVKQPYT